MSVIKRTKVEKKISQLLFGLPILKCDFLSISKLLITNIHTFVYLYIYTTLKHHVLFYCEVC